MGIVVKQQESPRGGYLLRYIKAETDEILLEEEITETDKTLVDAHARRRAEELRFK
jgi:hypothetical protein